jgi:ketosteroid isomerase-like protein
VHCACRPGRSSGVSPEALGCPEPRRVYRGHEGVRRFWSEFIDPWESIRIEITDTREAGDTLVVFVKFHGVGMGSGVELTVPFVHLLNFRNRKLLRFRAYADRDEALEAAGLSA